MGIIEGKVIQALRYGSYSRLKITTEELYAGIPTKMSQLSRSWSNHKWYSLLS